MWNGKELSYPLRRAIEEYREKIREADHEFILDLVQDIALRAEKEIKENEIKEKEKTRGFIADLVLEIANRADNVIKKNNAERQAIPHTVNAMVPMLLGAVEGTFLQRDNGEKEMEENIGLQEDDEPEPSLIDSWAQGAVPVQRVQKAVLKTENPVTKSKVDRKIQDWQIEFRNRYLSSEVLLSTKVKEIADSQELQISNGRDQKRKETVTEKKKSFAERLFGKKNMKSDSKEQKQSRFFRILSAILPCVPRHK